MVWFEDPGADGETFVTRHFVLSSYEVFGEDPTGGKPHFSAVQCFVDTSIQSTDVDNHHQGPPSSAFCLPLTLPPDAFHLIGVLGVLSNFPQTGRNLKNIFRLHAQGDPQPGVDTATGYAFAYRRLKEYAVNWRRARKCEYRERQGLKARIIVKTVDTGSGKPHWRVKRRRGKQVGKEVGPVESEGKTADNDDMKVEMPETSPSNVAPADTHSLNPSFRSPSKVAPSADTRSLSPSPSNVALVDTHSLSPSPSNVAPADTHSLSPSLTPHSNVAPPSSPRLSQLTPPPDSPLRPSFLLLGALLSACQQPNKCNLRTWRIPLTVHETDPTLRNGKLYPTFRVRYRNRSVQGLALLQVNEMRPKRNYKNCPWGCLSTRGGHEWFSSSKYPSLFNPVSANHSVLSRHLRRQPLLTKRCPNYPHSFAALTAHTISTPLVDLMENGSLLEIYFKPSAQSSGHYTAMYAASQAMFNLALETGGEDCLVRWRSFNAAPGQETLENMLEGYAGE